MAFFDFAAAFPSVAHAWLFNTIRAAGFPDGFISLFEGVYFHCECVGRGDSCTTLLFIVASGILQGCPLAGLAFTVAINPILAFFADKVEARGLGITKACADDIAAVCFKLSSLVGYARGFRLARALAGLHLKPPKCVIVPLAPPSPDLHDLVRRLLAEAVPDWSSMSVKDSAK